MYNVKDLLDHRRKLVVFLVLITVGLASLAASMLPSMNYLTGENMSLRREFLLPLAYVSLYIVFILMIIGILLLLSLISRKVYVIKMLDDSIKGIKRGRYMTVNAAPRREDLMQSYYAEKIKESGFKTFKMFNGMSQVERDEILGFQIDVNGPRSHDE